MPSTPRFSTPERSTTSSPMAARSSGVAAVMTVRMIASSTRGSLERLGADKPDPVVDERVASQDVEQQHPLQDLRHLAGDPQPRLDRLAAEIRERDDEPGDQDADRVQPPEEGHDDGREAIARRDDRLQLSDDAGHLHDAGEPGEPAGQSEREYRHAL